MFTLGFIFGFVFGFLSACILWSIWKPSVENFKNWKLADVKPWEKDSFYSILTVETSNGTRVFRGSGTVWRDMKSKRRCPTSEEVILSDLYETAKEDGRLNG